MANIAFNGSGSAYNNWFTADRVLSSSWTDIKSERHNYFSFEGHVIANFHVRRFYINRNYGGCPNDRGWLMVLEARDGCGWHGTSPFPIIFYSKLSTYGNPSDSSQFGRADMLTITVKLRRDVDNKKSTCA